MQVVRIRNTARSLTNTRICPSIRAAQIALRVSTLAASGITVRRSLDNGGRICPSK